jgi:phasin family protein
MTNSTFPFVFDPEKMQDLFRMPELDKMFDQTQMPGLNMDAMIAAHQKNVSALVEANKAMMSGYQELYKRQVALVEESLAKAKDQVLEMQSQPMSTEQASKNMESLKASFDKISADVRELTELAQQANTQAFDVIRGRFEEAMDEFRKTAEQKKG